MKVFKAYLIINIAFFFLHAGLYVVTVMGLGSGNSDAARSEIVNILILIAAIGLLPNVLLFCTSFIRKQEILENALWASVFSVLVMLGYFIVSRPLAMEFPI